MTNMSHFFILFRMRDKMASFELCVSPVLMENQHIWNFHSSLTLYNRKLIWYFGSPWYTIMSNMSHFFILFRMRDKMVSFELCITHLLMENQHIWNFHSSLTLYNRKLIWYFRIPLWQIWVIFSFCLEWETKWPVLNCVFHLSWWKINTFGIFTAH